MTATNNPPDRRGLHGLVTPDAHEAFHAFAAAEGCSVSALLQEIGDDIKNLLDSKTGEELVRRARLATGAQRRRSGGRRRKRNDG